MHNITHKRKAVSPVIATVILIAVAVALGIAVAFWASGLTSSFSKYEKLGVSTQYATQISKSSPGCGSSATSCWTLHLGGQNTGSSDASITQIQVNGVPISSSASNLNWSTSSATGTSFNIPVKSGETFSLYFSLDNLGSQIAGAHTFSSGQTVQVTIITAAGNNYPASIVLP